MAVPLVHECVWMADHRKVVLEKYCICTLHESQCHQYMKVCVNVWMCEHLESALCSQSIRLDHLPCLLPANYFLIFPKVAPLYWRFWFSVNASTSTIKLKRDIHVSWRMTCIILVALWSIIYHHQQVDICCSSVLFQQLLIRVPQNLV